MLRSLLPYPLFGLCIFMLLATDRMACSRGETDQPPPVTNAAAPDDSLEVEPPYDFADPAFVFELPDDLVEISALAVLDEQYLGAVEDENGRLYFIDLNTGEVLRHETFASDGDYEGLARVDNRVFTLRSDGDFFEIADWRSGNFESVRLESQLHRNCDAEGLTHDEANHRLLIACKESAGEDLDDLKAIYAYDLATGKVDKQPVFTISIEAFNKATYPNDGPLNSAIRKTVYPALDLSGFKPSALDIHPITGDLYVLSSVQQSVVVLSPTGEVQHIWKLVDSILKQPEGLAFLPNGDVFISSEGKSGHGVLTRYTYAPANGTSSE
jgi:uncharacterized protein YjiK